jgi:hypothetical protein
VKSLRIINSYSLHRSIFSYSYRRVQRIQPLTIDDIFTCFMIKTIYFGIRRLFERINLYSLMKLIYVFMVTTNNRVFALSSVYILSDQKGIGSDLIQLVEQLMV